MVKRNKESSMTLVMDAVFKVLKYAAGALSLVSFAFIMFLMFAMIRGALIAWFG
jgi:hypothetical protein